MNNRAVKDGGRVEVAHLALGNALLALLNGAGVLLLVARDLTEVLLPHRAESPFPRTGAFVLRDPGTGLLTREAFQVLLEQTVETAVRTGTSTALAVLDLDHPKIRVETPLLCHGLIHVAFGAFVPCWYGPERETLPSPQSVGPQPLPSNWM
jgi:hypothetical protein